MTYFANGTEGDIFEEMYCSRCIHAPQYEAEPPVDCPILTLHRMWNYDAVGEKADQTKHLALELFIPRGKDCSMFVEKKGAA